MAQSNQQQQENETNEGPQEQRQHQQRPNPSPQQRNRPVDVSPQQKSADEIKWEDYFPTEAAPPNQTQSTAQNERSDSEALKQPDVYERQRQAREKVRALKEQVDLSAFSDITVERGRHTDGLDMDFKNLTGKKAMQAIVWSEVLGPPKGRSAAGKYRSHKR